MQKFKTTLRGYDPRAVNAFVDDVIKQVEQMILEKKDYLEQIAKLEMEVKHYQTLERSLNQTIIAAQETGEQLRRIVKQESRLIHEEARKNANRIVNDALLRAEKIETQTNLMRKNISVFKHRLRNVIAAQMEMIDEIEILDL